MRVHLTGGSHMTDNSSAYNACVYDQSIINTLPYYTEFFKQITDLVEKSGKTDISWLDTGCGTGTMACNVLSQRKDVAFTLCDPSENMLEEAKAKLSAKTSIDITYINKCSQELDFTNRFDVITAVQCHHYLQPDEREVATRKCFEALKDNGIYITFENIRMSTEESDRIALDRWTDFIRTNFQDEEKVRKHVARRGTEVHPITIEEHLALLRKCGFKSVNLLWTSYLQAGFWAIKN